VPTDQPETNDAFAQRLQAVFADEARTHLAMVYAGLAGLTQISTQISTQAPTREATQAALVLGLQEALHTLKGAARAVGLGELEYLCDALATAIAAPGASGHFSAARLAQVQAAADLAGQLLAPPSARVRNQAMALAGQLEALAAPPSDYLKTT
jgi:chemotaxis protein histidine kinase CheA